MSVNQRSAWQLDNPGSHILPEEVANLAVYEKRASNGVRCIIDTRDAAAPGTAEYDRRVSEQCRAAYAILLDYAAKKIANPAESVDQMNPRALPGSAK